MIQLKTLLRVIDDFAFDPALIIRLEGGRNHTIIITAENRRSVARKLHLVQKQLGENRFLRVHKDHCVNRDHIARIVSERRTLLMSNGDVVGVSNSFWASVMTQLGYTLQ